MATTKLARSSVIWAAAIAFASASAAAHGIEKHKKNPASAAEQAAVQGGDAGAQNKTTAGGTASEPLPFDIGGAFSLIDHTGKAVRDSDFRGSYMLVFFGYANCPGICPTGLRTMTEALDVLGEDGEGIAPILITVDPASDTPSNLAPAVAKIHPRLIGLTGPLEDLSAAAKAYKVSAKPAGRSWQGIKMFDHGSYIYLMGPDGKFLTLFPPFLDPDSLATAIRGYMS